MRQIEQPADAIGSAQPHLCSAVAHPADHRRIRAQRVPVQRGQYRRNRRLRHRQHQLAFIGEVNRVQPQEFANAAHRRFHRQALLVDVDTETAGGGVFVQYGVHAAAGGVAQCVYAVNRPQWRNQRR
ncbi:hypothetical protein D3C79_926420 [compost metagenome]